MLGDPARGDGAAARTGHGASIGVRAVVMGGGTGTFTVLSSLKHYVTDVTAIVNMVDDGGSTGVLRDELGALPPGDVRQCLVALSSSTDLMRALFTYRFPPGQFGGHSFGNLFLTALEKVTGSFEAAVEMAGQVLAITGRVLPVTSTDVRLGLKRPDGEELIGERAIDQAFFAAGTRPDLFLTPAARVTEAASDAIREADIVVLGPGGLYTSLIPTLLVEGVTEALLKARGMRVYVCNLVTKPGQTDGFGVHDFVAEIQRHTGGEQLFDFVVYNTAHPPPELVEHYEASGETLVRVDRQALARLGIRAVGEPLVSGVPATPDPDDVLVARSLIRHDGDHLARLLMRLYFT
jgi:uncharacterized cofD-like protein